MSKQARAEEYGALGNGEIQNGHVQGYDDSEAIRRCIKEHGECWLQGKTYVIGSPLVFGPDDTPTKNVKIFGLSKRRSILAFSEGNVAQVGDAQESMIETTNGVETFMVDELSIYCNGANRRDHYGHRKTIGAVESRAFTDMITDLRVWGQSRAVRECFAVGSWSDYTTDHKWARGTTVIERIDFSKGPALDHTGVELPEITYIAACQRNGVRISDNLFRDLPRFKGAKPFRQQLISFHGSNGVTIEGNVFENVDGHCIYADNKDAKNIRIVGNSVSNSTGVFVYLLNSFAAGSYENVDISGNVVHLARPKDSIGPSAVGVILAAHPDKNPVVFRNVHVHGNMFRLKNAGTVWNPATVLFQTNNSSRGFDNVVVQGNTTDVPIQSVGNPQGVSVS